MNYQQFILEIQDKVNALLDEDILATIHHAQKNNGKVRVGLTISTHNTNISPTIYLEEYFSQYQNGRGIPDIANNIIELYHEVKFEHSWDIEQIHEFEQIKSKLAYKLIHYEANNVLLNDIPHIPYLDLAIVFFLLLETTDRGAGTILITKELQNSWNISLDELFQAASENTPKILSAEFKPMHTVMLELLGRPDEEEELCESHMYVLSNEYRHFGATCIIYDRVLEDIGNQLNEDFYVLPSSIHEVIILPAHYCFSKEALDEMIVEINQTQVSEEETLADHAYYFSREKNQLLQTF